ncbi:MAG: GNAT family N-acetyltransferase [Chloroflexota bacterium]|nr:GNAT family N-acetyltransferase [Chloroflexota bacterium]
MALEVRPYTEQEADAFFRVPGIVFGNHTVAGDGAGMPPVPPEWTLCAFEDGQLSTAYAAFPFMMRLNGGTAPAAGVTLVGTLPWFRRRGHLRAIIEADFRRRHEQGQEPIAILLASIAAIYQRYGYAVCSARYQYSIDPKLIGFAPTLAPASGTWREASRDELPLLQSIYDEFIRERNGYLLRLPQIWEWEVLGLSNLFGIGEQGPSLAAVYEEAGEPKGYVCYAPKEYQMYPDGAAAGQRIFVRDYAWLTPSAYRAIWEHFATFDLARRIVVDRAPVDDPAFDVMLDPRELHATKGDWLLGRIIDLDRALPLRPYGCGGRLTFEVRDAMCPWNAGRWALDAGPEGAAVARTDESPQLSLDIAALAQILFGQVSPSRAVRYGRAEASPGAPLALWDAMWRTHYAPFCPDIF